MCRAGVRQAEIHRPTQARMSRVKTIEIVPPFAMHDSARKPSQFCNEFVFSLVDLDS
jgi:hypothetical protein